LHAPKEEDEDRAHPKHVHYARSDPKTEVRDNPADEQQYRDEKQEPFHYDFNIARDKTFGLNSFRNSACRIEESPSYSTPIA
jgi:hypothetical protein